MVRFIPTCVGNCEDVHKNYEGCPVHPHVCGELVRKIQSSCLMFGSSPRVWGTAVRPVFRNRFTRFIPTCVGNWRARFILSRLWSVHPHVCGELRLLARLVSHPRGSSPRVWGTVSSLVLHIPLFRFIPTCVGNCAFSRICSPRVPVHPHVCGELPRRVAES